MTSILSSGAATEVADSVVQAVEAFGLGELTLDELQENLLQALAEDPDQDTAIRKYLEDELRSRTLTIADYGDLIDAIGAFDAENIPTEEAQDSPGQSGVYRVIDAGEMIPAEQWPYVDEGDVFGNDVFAGEEFADDGDDAAVHDPDARSDDAFADELFEALDSHTQPFADDESESGNPGSVSADAAAESDESEPADGAEVAAGAAAVDAPAAEREPPGPGTVLRERFRLDEEVARGAMGVVYRATDLMKQEAEAGDPHLAIKLVNPQFSNDKNAVRALQNEVGSCQHLSHSNIVHLFGLDRDGDQWFVTMEWLEGETLADLLDKNRGRGVPPAQAYGIIEQVCDALIYAHDRGVVHADVKPGNIFLTDSGEVKLIDFGIASMEFDWAKRTGVDDPVALTPAYSSCERLERSSPTKQDDLYSLACVIYRLVAGRRVFGPLDAFEAEAQAIVPVPISGLNDSRWGALRQALSYRRHQRQADVAEFVTHFGRRSVARPGDAEVWSETLRLRVLSELAADGAGHGRVDVVLDAGTEPDAEADLADVFADAVAAGPDEATASTAAQTGTTGAGRFRLLPAGIAAALAAAVLWYAGGSQPDGEEERPIRLPPVQPIQRPADDAVTAIDVTPPPAMNEAPAVASADPAPAAAPDREMIAATAVSPADGALRIPEDLAAASTDSTGDGAEAVRDEVLAAEEIVKEEVVTEELVAEEVLEDEAEIEVFDSVDATILAIGVAAGETVGQAPSGETPVADSPAADSTADENAAAEAQPAEEQPADEPAVPEPDAAAVQPDDNAGFVSGMAAAIVP